MKRKVPVGVCTAGLIASGLAVFLPADGVPVSFRDTGRLGRFSRHGVLG
jgi:hypothetical protein